MISCLSASEFQIYPASWSSLPVCLPQKSGRNRERPRPSPSRLSPISLSPSPIPFPRQLTSSLVGVGVLLANRSPRGALSDQKTEVNSFICVREEFKVRYFEWNKCGVNKCDIKCWTASTWSSHLTVDQETNVRLVGLGSGNCQINIQLGVYSEFSTNRFKTFANW